jgi:hypothetical protein
MLCESNGAPGGVCIKPGDVDSAEDDGVDCGGGDEPASSSATTTLESSNGEEEEDPAPPGVVIPPAVAAVIEAEDEDEEAVGAARAPIFCVGDIEGNNKTI